ncbi:MAG: DNA mismatch repair protein MutS [Candidatus Cryptobacteroides sp.]|uniref:DNA mismatch repair protein MutS n=1 Tax=Candidatus Cryptobacteroides sp. TaxID=2952915 RepID=UPI002A917486|nr:DNA mismatch repair protein MutS [Candidatus Cryptobacteroides sp.]MDY5566222.1 DNA mismatch repair protein MutS [Candidatus Cryptobacteroides sp.]
MAKGKLPEDTPLIKQFFSVKAEHPEAVLLYRVGDFYESYSSDAVLVSKVLGLVLTKKSNGEKGYIEMAGFPHHAIDVYLPKLVRAGHKVAVCDQLEDPKLTKKLVKRGVTELVTPGITFNDQLLDQKENNFLAGLTFEKDLCGAAFLDVSTGTFQVTQGSLDYVGTLLASLSPKEIVVQRGCEKGVRAKYGDDLYISTLEEWAFVYDAAEEKLKKQFGVKSLKGFAVDRYPLGICSAGALLVYLEQTRHTGLRNICSLSRIDRDRFVWMDKFTIRNLELFDSSAGGEGVSLISVIDRCSSPMGSRMLRNWLAMPVMDIRELNSRYDVVSHFVEAEEDRNALQEMIGGIGDLERIISRAATGKIMPREIMQLGRGLGHMEPISSLCSGRGVAALDNLIAGMKDCSELLQTITTTMAPEPAAAIGKGEVIARGIDPELDELRNISSGGKDYLLALQRSEAERTGITSLKIGYNNVFGYYIEVRNTFRDLVPQEWIRKQTLVNAERYITEELKEYESKILGAEERIYAIETGIYGELVAKIQKQIVAIQTNSRIIARLDILAGFAQLAMERNYCRPQMAKDLVLDIRDGRHPVIETLMPPGEEYVPNDVLLDDRKQQVIILTGPNMAGKSALLRQTALIVLLAQIGSFVPASSAHIGCFDKIFTRVGASDNISRGESTFMVEMLETSMILHNLSARSLVLLDEIGRGTSTYDGMSIARAIVEYIHEYGHGAKTLFATHYHELNDLEEIYPRVRNFHITVREVGTQVIFLRKLKEGGTAHSFGIHVARMAGMPKEVIESAENTLRALEMHDAQHLVSASTGQIGKPVQTKSGILETDGSLQLSFFQLDDPALESLRDKLHGADLNNMTPLQAFDLLRQMKEELGV